MFNSKKAFQLSLIGANSAATLMALYNLFQNPEQCHSLFLEFGTHLLSTYMIQSRIPRQAQQATATINLITMVNSILHGNANLFGLGTALHGINALVLFNDNSWNTDNYQDTPQSKIG